MGKSAVYYNEWDNDAADWLEELIKRGHLPAGIVDRRSITDVEPEDLKDYTSCHFFAGIGGWPLALRLAGWPDDYPVWTGSPPCQPYSAAGRKLGFADPRHLAPKLLDLVAECRPGILFGEQVEKAIGQHWLDFIFLDLEAEGYACAATVLPACSVGAPHQRNRIFFGAVSDGELAAGARKAVRLANANGYINRWPLSRGEREAQAIARGDRQDIAGARQPGGAGAGLLRTVGDDSRIGSIGRGLREVRAGQAERGEAPIGTLEGNVTQGLRATGDVADDSSEGRERRIPGREDTRRELVDGHTGRGRAAGVMGDGAGQRREGVEVQHLEWGKDFEIARAGGAAGSVADYLGWTTPDWLGCKDGKVRPVEPGTFPLDHGVPGRVVRLRGYGNAIVPAVAKVFVECFLEAAGDSENAKL